MGIDENNTIFLTQEDQELFELQQLKVESSESFDFKQGYDFAINEIHSQYNLRNIKNNETSIKNTSQNKTKNNVEAPKKKILQILPRENKKNSNPPSPKKSPSPKIVDITEEVAQSFNNSQNANTTKAPSLVKSAIPDPKKNLADSKSTNPKTINTKASAESSKSEKASAASKSILEKKTKDNKIQETWT